MAADIAILEQHGILARGFLHSASGSGDFFCQCIHMFVTGLAVLLALLLLACIRRVSLTPCQHAK